MTLAPPAIQLKSLGKRFAKRWVLQNIDLTLVRGEFVVLLGASGCGKSTLLRLIAGIEAPDSGAVYIDGNDTNRTPPHRRGCSMAFQGGICYDRWTAERNIRHASEGGDPAWIETMLSELELHECRHQKPTSLSGGERQRLSLARAMISPKPIMLLDEPLAQLHPNMRSKVRDWIRTVHRQRNKTTLYVTHDLSEALWLADRIVLMQAGKMVALGTPRQLFSPPTQQAAADFLGFCASSHPCQTMDKSQTMSDQTSSQYSPSPSLEIIALEEWVPNPIDQTANSKPVLQAWQGTVLNCRWIGHGWELHFQPTVSTSLPSSTRDYQRIHIADSTTLAPSLRSKLQELEKRQDLNAPIRFVSRLAD